MNIEELINNIEKDPKAYIGENISLNNIFIYINGFRFSKLHTYGNIDIEECFTHKFCDYCINWINKDKNLNISFSIRGYVFYIETYYKKNEKINIFFNICNDFFKDFHSKNKK